MLAKVLTVSTSAHRGERDDSSGPALCDLLRSNGFEIVETEICADGHEEVSAALRALTDGFSGLVVTTGGTGFAPSDVTPEATLTVLDRQAPGMAEAMRLASPFGRLSRAAAGTIGTCLVLNTPGSPSGACETLSAVLDAVPHALALLAGASPH